jgi:hypothetical protein
LIALHIHTDRWGPCLRGRQRETYKRWVGVGRKTEALNVDEISLYECIRAQI